MKELIEKFSMFLKKWAFGWVAKWLKDNKKANIEKINKDFFNVPIFTEKQEGEFLEMLYDLLVKLLDTTEVK